MLFYPKFYFIVLTTLIFFNAKAQTAPLPIEPTKDFKTPEPPDYTKISNWAAHPDQIDQADKVPENKLGLKEEQKYAKADVFFIYPTIFTKTPTNEYYWNASTSDDIINNAVNNSTILNQATIFNGSCRVFSPRYRQAHLRSFYSDDKKMAKIALDLAYKDVKTAFQYYLKNENNGRPIVIAGHSQGTYHAKRLLQEFFDGTKLQSQLVVAYLVGYSVQSNTFNHLKPLYTANGTGGFVTWCTFKDKYYPVNYEKFYKNGIVVNPQEWTKSDKWSPRNKNSGLVNGKFQLIEKAVKARAANGLLWIKTPYVLGRVFLKRKNWHVADYNLFWMNTRENVALRVQEFLLKK